MRFAICERADFIDEVELRLPDIVFESKMHLDLGGRFVELHHIGHGNTHGDNGPTLSSQPQRVVSSATAHIEVPAGLKCLGQIHKECTRLAPRLSHRSE